jgi:CHAD domain-containing protein
VAEPDALREAQAAYASALERSTKAAVVADRLADEAEAARREVVALLEAPTRVTLPGARRHD